MAAAKEKSPWKTEEKQDATLIPDFNEIEGEEEELEPGSEDETATGEERSTPSPQGREDIEEPSGEEAQKPPEPEEEQPAEFQLSPRLQQAARRAKLSGEDLSKLGVRAGDFLENLADAQDMVSAELGRIGKDFRQQQPVPYVQPQIPPQQAPLQQGDPLAEKLALELDADTFGEDLISKLSSPVASYVNTLRDRLIRVERQMQEAEAAKLVTTVDSFFEEKGKDEHYASMFGEGKTGELVGSKAHKARMELLQEADLIAAGAYQRGWTMQPQEALERALSHVTREDHEKAAKDTIRQKAQKRSRLIINRPTRRRTTREYANPKERAEEAYSKLREQMGKPLAEHET